MTTTNQGKCFIYFGSQEKTIFYFFRVLRTSAARTPSPTSMSTTQLLRLASVLVRSHPSQFEMQLPITECCASEHPSAETQNSSPGI
jgi:hypothetical protein